ncbi:hypothetical protein [Geothrix sp. PMB-07]|uniref:hypothetical protein n=1 Tax=Geothrix sp. PMB-07 TaxID=3068640 RepID=UPI00274038F0|nr:hypothetical protein [Geothrix sp. PMB-07]WLT31447.1 hypothetical protein Q9293_17190 [Geothrix sp. PMB-07]
MNPAANPSTAALICLLTLVACSKPEATPPLAKQISGAATAPFNDLNLVHDKIPPVLLEAQKAPYGAPKDATCAGLKAEIDQLDAALGPDLDAPGHPERRNLLEKGWTEAEGAAVGAVRSAAESLIPYRSWVRKLSGAERFSRQVTAAIGAGIVRRAYLKGLGQAQGCGAAATPASAPLPAETKTADPVPAAS